MSQLARNTSLAEPGSDDSSNISEGEAFPRITNPFEDYGGLFSMCLDRSIEENNKLVEGWKVDADGMLIFAGVFSAAVAALLAVSVQNIQQNPQNISNIYLAHISQQLSTQPNGSQSFIPNTLSNTTEPFIPPTSCVWVNGLWSLSLVISLTGALMTTLLQHWARRYLKLANSRCHPQEKARIHAFYWHGVEKLYIHWTIEAVPPLLHLSLFLFFAGLSMFLFRIHSTIFKIVTTWIALCTILYAYFTFLPIIHKDSPYSAPPSALVFFCLTGLRYLFFQILRRFPQIDPPVSMPLHRRDPGAVHLGDFFSTTLSKTAEEFALKLRPDIDYHSFLRTFDSLYEDTDLEKFFEGLSCLCDAGTGNGSNIQEGFIIPHKKKLQTALIGLMNRTLSSNLVTDIVKRRRMVICTKTVDLTSLFGPWCFLRCVLFGEWSKFLECVEFGLAVEKWKSTDKVTSFAAQCVAALTISIVRDRNRDERWFQLVNGLHNASELPLLKYIAHGDSLPLANALFIVRRTVQTYSGANERHRNNILKASLKTLKTVCKIKIGDTLPELQHEFCGLWNQLVHTAQTSERPHHSSVSTTALKNIRKLYLALHERSGTHPTAFHSTDDRDPVLDNPMSYPLCTIDDHRTPLPIQDLQFDEPVPDAPGDVAPDLMPIPTFVY